MAAFVSIGLELGSLTHMIYIIFSPNLTSPIWWMGTLYSLELVFLIAKLWRMHKGDWHSSSSRYLGIASMLCAVFAALMLGSVFGLTEARPTYFGPFISVFCLVIALLSGMAMIILYINICSLIKKSCSQVSDQAMNMLARKFSFVIGLTLIFYFLKLALASGSTYPEFATAINFSLILFLVVPYVLMISPGLHRTAWAKTLASAITLIGIFAVHMQILIGGQVRPVGPKAEGLPEVLTYFPSIWEILVVVFALCVMLLLYTLGERFLRLDDTPHGQSA
jgi:molybdopterin-containing oxidoreductase family membrane subunit